MVYTHLKLKLLDYGCFEELINVSAWFVSYIRHDLCLNDDVFFFTHQGSLATIGVKFCCRWLNNSRVLFAYVLYNVIKCKINSFQHILNTQ